MKKLIALFTALMVLTPAFALAQAPGVRANLQGEVRASSTPKLGQSIKNIASSTRAEWKDAASTTRMAVKAKVDAIHALIAQHKEFMRLRADAARQKAHEHFGDKIEKLVGNISDRLASTSQRLADLADRADARIDELKVQGFAMSSSTILIARAQADIAAANIKITAVNTALADAMSLGTTTAKTEIPAVRTAVKAAEDALKLVKLDLQQTLMAIKVESAATTTTTI